MRRRRRGVFNHCIKSCGGFPAIAGAGLIRGPGLTRGALDLCGKPQRHSRITHLLGEDAPLFQHLDCARYPAATEQYTGFAEDPRVTRALFCSIHEASTRYGNG